MTLSLADVERWDPAAITAVFDAAIRRTDGTRTAAAAVSNTMAFLEWDGYAAQAARDATHRMMLDLDSHADACLAVANAASHAAAEVASIKLRLSAIRDHAATFHLSIDDATGAVSLPADLASFPASDQNAILAAQLDTISAIIGLLADARNADEDLAAAIRGADGGLSPGQVNAEVNPGPYPLPQLPPPGTAPADVDRWWDSLNPSQQDWVKSSSPDAVRNRDGIPADVRDELNEASLYRELARFQNGWLDTTGWHTDQAKLADLGALRTTLDLHPGASLLLLDTTSSPYGVLAAVAVGDVDNARRVGVTVGGMNTRVSSSVDAMVTEASYQRTEAIGLRTHAGVADPGAVASIAWLGYHAPTALASVTHDDLARLGAGPLNSFYNGVAATSNVADQHITAFGHSYGSLTTSLALQQGAPVDDVVLYGSPGAEIAAATQLGVAPGHAFYMVGVDDHVADLIPAFGAFGPGLQDVPGMTELSVNTGVTPGGMLGDGDLHERAYGHSEYARIGANGELRMSGYNMAAVMAGLPQDFVYPPDLPPATIPSGPGPFGLPIPNPAYHP